MHMGDMWMRWPYGEPKHPKHHAQLTVHSKFLAHCSWSKTFWPFPSGYPSVSLPGNGEIFPDFFWTGNFDKWTKTFRDPFRENPLPLPGSFRDCGLLLFQKTRGKHLENNKSKSMWNLRFVFFGNPHIHIYTRVMGESKTEGYLLVFPRSNTYPPSS